MTQTSWLSSRWIRSYQRPAGFSRTRVSHSAGLAATRRTRSPSCRAPSSRPGTVARDVGRIIVLISLFSSRLRELAAGKPVKLGELRGRPGWRTPGAPDDRAGGMDQTSRKAERTWPVRASRPDTTGREAPADRRRRERGDGKAMIGEAGHGACRDPARVSLLNQ